MFSFSDKHKDASFYERLILLEKQFPGATVLMHKNGVLPKVYKTIKGELPWLCTFLTFDSYSDKIWINLFTASLFALFNDIFLGFSRFVDQWATLKRSRAVYWTRYCWSSCVEFESKGWWMRLIKLEVWHHCMKTPSIL